MQIDQKLDEIFATFDTAMSCGDFAFVAKTLNDLVFTLVPVEILIGHCAAAYPGRKHIYNYDFFVKRVEAELKNRGRSDVRELLQGFRDTFPTAAEMNSRSDTTF